MNFGIMMLVVWVGCFLIVSIDSVYRKISPVYWRLASLFGGPFALLAYSLIRERKDRD